MKYIKHYMLLCGLLITAGRLTAQNPLITDQFTADPSARVFDDKVYLYPSHDIVATPGHGRLNWFCMQDYHVFSSPNLTDWTDHGVIVSQNKVAWADSTAYSMWAPDCIERNGKYYFYFPATVKSGKDRGFAVGVAIADKPYGPFVPQPEPIAGLHGIDPNVQINKDGQAYIYWAQGNLYGAKLKANMLELDSEPIVLQGFPDKGLKEGPYLFERNGIYYMTYPHVANKIERLEYAMSNSPLGPFKYGGVIMDESASGCWTNHQSVIQFRDQWYLFYHNNDFSPSFDKNRSVRTDSLFFNNDGTIRKVNPTLRGVGLSPATSEIQIDRYSELSQTGASIQFVDTAHHFKGWATSFDQKGAWIRYNSVEFKKSKLTKVTVMANSPNGAEIEIRLDRLNGTLISSAKINKSPSWNETASNVLKTPIGKHDIFIILKNANPVTIDWIQFE